MQQAIDDTTDQGSKTLNKLKFGAGVAFAVLVAVPTYAQGNKRVDFVGDVSAEATTAVKVEKLEQLRGVRSVIIPQFTVEFVSKSDALSAQEGKKQNYVSVVYEVGGIAPSSSAAAVASPRRRWFSTTRRRNSPARWV